jgi:hypothetical protein
MPDIAVTVQLAEDFAQAMTEDEARDLGLILRDQARVKLGIDSLAPAGTIAQGRAGAMVTARTLAEHHALIAGPIRNRPC